MPDHTLKEKVLAWLGEQGHPFEMKVAATLRREDVSVRQSLYYTDPEEAKAREIDIWCSREDDFGSVSINFLIECKDPSKPWILLSSDHTLVNYNRLFAFGVLSSEMREKMNPVENIERMKALPWFIKNGRIGYSIIQALGGNSDVSYKAVLSALKASLFAHQENNSAGFGKRPMHAAFPVVVISSPLFEAYLNESGELEVTEIEQGHLFFPRPIAGFDGTCVRIVTEKGLSRLRKEIEDISARLISMTADREYMNPKSVLDERQ